MNKTKIEWVKNPDGTQGYTWNPITGCNNQIDGMCQGGNFPCYAYRLANGRLRDRYLANKYTATQNYDEDSYPFYPRFWPERLLQPSANFSVFVRTKRKGIFVCDMSDLFGIGIPEEWTERVMSQIKCYYQHRFYLLTKQPQNLVKFSPFPDNCWPGVSVTSNGAMTLALTNLATIKASIKFISFEPLLGSIGMNDHMSMKGIVDWVIIGAQTKPYKPPQIEWVKEIVEACDKAGISVFLKDNLKPLIIKQGQGIYIPQWARGYKELRQEMPR